MSLGQIEQKDDSKVELLDITDSDVFSQQERNAKAYQNKAKGGKWGFISVMFFCYSLLMCDLIFNINISRNLVFLIGLYVSGALAIFGTLFFARCPNCNALQVGNSYGVSVNEGIIASYSKGFSPFAKRCRKCTYYLSVKQLHKDRGNADNHR